MSRKQAMHLSLKAVILSAVLWGFPVQAQSSVQVSALVEALRQAAPQTSIKNDGLYSDWQILPANIPRWSKGCTGQELSIAQFEASPVTAREIIECVMRDVVRDEYPASGKNESITVRRAAAWWMTGDPQRYNSGQTAPYTQKVLSFYQRQLGSRQPLPVEPQQSNYDRHMQIGYSATKKRDYQTALISFRRALAERPGDTYATQAIRNVASRLQHRQATLPMPRQPTASQGVPAQSASVQAGTITQVQAVDLINQWLQAKQQIFASPFDRQLVDQLTTGELSKNLAQPSGVMAWLKNNQAYYRFGVQKVESVERFVANGNKATVEVKVTEDRTLYRNGKVDASQTDFETRLIRYTLQSVDGRWKIADYKTTDGSLLERAVVQ